MRGPAGLRGRIGVRRRWRRDDADACGVTGGVTGARRLMCVAEWSRSPFPGKGEARPCGGAPGRRGAGAARSGDRLLGHRFGKTRLASDDGRRADGGSRAGCLFRARRDRSARHASLSGRARPHLASDERRATNSASADAARVRQSECMPVSRRQHVRRCRRRDDRRRRSAKHFDAIWKGAAGYRGDAPHPRPTGVGVTWLDGFRFEIKMIAKRPQALAAR